MTIVSSLTEENNVIFNSMGCKVRATLAGVEASWDST